MPFPKADISKYWALICCTQELSQTEYCSWREWLSIPAMEPEQQGTNHYSDGPRWRALVVRGRRLREAGDGKCARDVERDWADELFSYSRRKMRDENAMRPEDFAEEHALLARDDVYSSSTGCANNVWLHVQSSALAVI